MRFRRRHVNIPKYQPEASLPSSLTSAGKSKKDFKPKAPLRRPPVSTPNQSTLRASVESQPQSQRQTPQLQAAPVGRGPSPEAEPDHASLRVASGSAATTSTIRARKSKTPERTLPPGRAAQATLVSSVQEDKPFKSRPISHAQHDAHQGSAPILPNPSARSRSQERHGPQDTSLHSSPIVDPSPATVQPAFQAPALEPSEPRPFTGAADVAQASKRQEATGRRLSRRLIAQSEKQIATSQADFDHNDDLEAHGDSVNVARVAPTGSAPVNARGVKRGPKRKAVVQDIDPQTVEAKRAKRISRLQRIADSVVAEAAGEAPKTAKSRKGRRKRATTEEDSETAEIAPNATKMADLCRDRHAGKNSTRESRLAERERDGKASKAREKLNALMGETLEAPQNPDQPPQPAKGKPRLAQLRERPSTPTAQLAPRVRLVNGQIVQDEASRVVDRHAVADGERDEDEEVHEEDDLTRRTNSGSHLKRLPPFRWSSEMTEQFYEGLRLFGTDFMMMTVLFPGLTRRQLKLKFVKEEHTNEEMVKQVLIHERKTPDLEELQRLANVVYREPAAVEKELEEDRKRLEEEDRLEREAMEQIERERQEAVEREARQGEAPATGGQDADHKTAGHHDEEPQPKHDGVEISPQSTVEVSATDIRSSVKASGTTPIARPTEQTAASAA